MLHVAFAKIKGSHKKQVCAFQLLKVQYAVKRKANPMNRPQEHCEHCEHLPGVQWGRLGASVGLPALFTNRTLRNISVKIWKIYVHFYDLRN